MSLVTLIKSADTSLRDAVVQIEEWLIPKEAVATGKIDADGRSVFTLLKDEVAVVVAEVKKEEAVVKEKLTKAEAKIKAKIDAIEPEIKNLVKDVEAEAEKLAFEAAALVSANTANTGE